MDRLDVLIASGIAQQDRAAHWRCAAERELLLGADRRLEQQEQRRNADRRGRSMAH